MSVRGDGSGCVGGVLDVLFVSTTAGCVVRGRRVGDVGGFASLR